MPFQFPWQYPQRRQCGRAGPVQVIQAYQDGYCRSPLFQVRLYLADPPRGRIRPITIGIIGGGPGERLTQGCAQREERDGPAQLVRCSRRQGKPLSGGLLGGLAKRQRLANTWLPLHQHYPAGPSPGTPQQVMEYLPLRVASGFYLLAGRLLWWRSLAPSFRRGVTDHRCHINRLAPQVELDIASATHWIAGPVVRRWSTVGRATI